MAEKFYNPFLSDRPVEFVEIDKSLSANLTIPAKIHRGMNIPLVIPDSYYIDRDVKTSIYHIPGLMEKLIGLTDSAKSLFFYIIFKLRNGKDTIRLDYTTLSSLLNIKTEVTYYSCINQLIDIKVLVKKKVKDFYINPHFFFAGNRYNGINKLYEGQFSYVHEADMIRADDVQIIAEPIEGTYRYDDDEDNEINNPR